MPTFLCLVINCSITGTPIGRDLAIRRAILNAGIEDFRVHDFRHTCASRLVQNGMTVQETAHILGHSNIATTMRYAHLEKNQVAEKMKAVIDRFND